MFRGIVVYPGWPLTVGVSSAVLSGEDAADRSDVRKGKLYQTSVHV
jgi:hypothetical protein